MMADAAELIAVLEPDIQALGYEIVDLELNLGGRGGVLRLFIDSPDGITLEDCEKVSHQVSALLDVEDPIPGHYTLEVSSPGVNRRLRRHADFERFVGERVKIELSQPTLEGRRRFAGTLEEVESDSVTVQVDGERHVLPQADIALARLAPEIKV
ncbi:MAG: ribosome maturation factor RimP [Gammaproteobacteria bacterium]